ncbi:MAG TPA: phosphoketolase family protein [Polyangiales bacterium]|nr:phosphoketolase family protein [Polyangiales bacterium]
MSSLSPELLRKMHAYWRAANYLSVGQIYLLANPLLREPLRLEHIKPRLLGHWGTTPGLNFIYVHMNRAIRERDLNVMYVIGPGHGAPGILANAYLEGTYSEVYPHVSRDEVGLARLFKQFSFPGGVPSHVAAETPGSIHEGGELGYALSHAFGAVFDNRDLIACCVIGDGEAETGPLATSWHSIDFLDRARDGAVLPILHLNGYKIAGPTVLARIPRKQLEQLLRGYGYAPRFVAGDDPARLHPLMAAALDETLSDIARLQAAPSNEAWPMIVLETPKGWTCPKHVDGVEIEGTFRAHQVPLTGFAGHPEHVALLEHWLKSYGPEELFDKQGRLVAELAELPPKAGRRMSANVHANGGLLRRELALPDFREYAVEVPQPGAIEAESTRVQGAFIRDVVAKNPDNFLIVSPDETASNRWTSVFEVTGRRLDAEIKPNDEAVARNGRVLEMLSEHQCEGWLEGYLLTGRHGFFNCYEAFVHIVDSMFNQHAKWLDITREIPWRAPIASLNYLLTSHVWRQDHNGFSHQDPGFLNHVVNKKADVIRVYLPPDANTLLSVTDHCLRSVNYVNVIVAGKQPEPQWLSIDEAVLHATAGISEWKWASRGTGEPDVVMACAGDVPTLETLAAVDLLRQHLPKLRVRVVNVVDLMRLQSDTQHPHGMTDREFDALFTVDKPVIFAFHGYPTLVHQLIYRRYNRDFHVHGFQEEGSTTTPFDMVVRNGLDRFRLVEDVVARVPSLGPNAEAVKRLMQDKRREHRSYVNEHGDDMPEVKHWRWQGSRP